MHLYINQLKKLKWTFYTKESCDLFKCKKNDIEELEVRF